MSEIAFIFDDQRAYRLVEQLLQAGFAVCYLDQSAKKASPHASTAEARSAKDVKTVLAKAQTVITLLKSQVAAEEIYLASGGIFALVKKPSLFIDLTLTSPGFAKELDALSAVHDHAFVEAPFRQEGATLIAAGEKDSLKKAARVLGALAGGDFLASGIAGTASAVYLAEQIALAAAAVGIAEALAFAETAGANKKQTLALLNRETGSLHSATSRLGQAMAENDFASGPSVKELLSSLRLAEEMAENYELPLPGLETAQQLFDLLQLIGDDKRGIQSIALTYADDKTAEKFGLDWSLAQKAMEVYERAADYGAGQDDEDYANDYENYAASDYGDSGEHYHEHNHEHIHEHAYDHDHEHSHDHDFEAYHGAHDGGEASPPSMSSYFSHN